MYKLKPKSLPECRMTVIWLASLFVVSGLPPTVNINEDTPPLKDATRNLRPELLQTDLVAEWKFDENFGTIAYDTSGNNNAGTIYNATWTNGASGSALKFDGADDYVKVTTITRSFSQITVEAWIKTTADFEWSVSPSFLGTLSSRTGTEVSFTATHAGTGKIFVNGTYGGVTKLAYADIVITEPAANQKPSVVILKPQNNSVVSGVLNISGTATDDRAVVRVELKFGSKSWVYANGTHWWYYIVDTTKFPNGALTVYVRAFDGELYSEMVILNLTVKNITPTEEKYNLFMAGLLLLILSLIIAIIGFVVYSRAKRRRALETKTGVPPSAPLTPPSVATEKVPTVMIPRLVQADVLTRCTYCNNNFTFDDTKIFCPCGNNFHQHCANLLGKCPKCKRQIAIYVVIKEEPKTAIDELFLIYRDGRLLKHLTRRLKPDMDEYILASMFTAVEAFVKDSFREEGTLDELKFGEMKAYIARGEFVNLVAVIAGEEKEPIKPQLDTAIQAIETKHREILKDWDGRMDAIAPLTKQLRELLDGKYKK